MIAFHSVKSFLVTHAGLDKDALHIYVALLVYLLACVLFRWKASSWKPWVLVVIAAFAGEWFDHQRNLAVGQAFDLDKHWKDFWNTLLVPTILVLVARFTNIFDRHSKATPNMDGD